MNSLNLGSMSASNGFAICTWFVFDATTNYARIFDFGIGPKNNNLLLAREGLNANLVVHYYNSLVYGGYFAFPEPIINGQWRHVCIVNKGNKWSFYDNGEFMASQIASFSLQNVLLTSNYIGRSNWDVDRLFIGRVDEFKIYQKTILPSDVASIYSGMSGALVPDLLLSAG
jgi:hypothetical protein